VNRFKRSDEHGFTYIFGNEELFCDQTCREMNPETHIAQTLIDSKCDLVLIYDSTKGFHYPKSFEARMDGVYEKITGARLLSSDRSSAAAKLRKRGIFSHADSAPDSAPPSPQDQTVNTQGRLVWQRDIIPVFDAILNRPRDNLKAAIVIMNMRSFLDAAIVDFNDFFDRHKTRGGNDLFILCFNGWTPQTALNRQASRGVEKYLTEWYQSINENSGINANIIEIRTPPQAEIRNFLNRRRLIGQLNIPASQLDIITEKIFRFTRGKKVSLTALDTRIDDWQRYNGLSSVNFNKDTFSEIIGIESHDKTSRQMLGELIGLSFIKKKLEGIERQVKNAGVIKKDMPYQPRFFETNNENKPNLKLHFALKGNPGTGKTTVAELLGRYLYEIGALTSGHVVKCVANNLMSDHVGGTAIQAAGKVNDALGGVLFIDEISAIAGKRDELSRSGGSHGFAKELNGVLLNAMESYPDLSVVIAGYPKDVDSFIESDDGYASRFAHPIALPDYNAEELAEIFRLMAKKSGYGIAPDLEKILADFMRNWLMQKPGDNTWGNAREVRNLILEIGSTIDSDKIIKIKDIPERRTVGKKEYNLKKCIENTGSDMPSPTQKLDELIGLAEVKKKIKDLSKLIERDRKRGKESRPSLNFVFSGNPGTGKTTVAQLFGEMLAKIGLLEKSAPVEVERKNLVGSAIGETEIITNNVFQSAIGGVLFIDEAYELSGKGANDYGKIVIDSLVKFSEEYKGQVCIILAGYTEKMKEFLKSNSGLNRRFMTANQIEFPDYSPEELFLIFKHICKENDYKTSKDFDKYLRECIPVIKDSIKEGFGNGGEMRNLYENCELALSSRDTEGISDEFTASDLEEAMKMMKMPVPPPGKKGGQSHE